MVESKLAIIGGTGVYNIEAFEVVRKIYLETPYGSTSSEILELKKGKFSFYFLARHGFHHQFNPSEINYRANIYALKSLGVSSILSVSAVGSLSEKHPPGMFVFPSQFIDWTKGKRARTFFENGLLGHVSCAHPVFEDFQKDLYQMVQDQFAEGGAHLGGTYWCIEGPQFSTQAESKFYRASGGDVIGMTNVPEVFLAAEAGISYVTLAMVTDFDSWSEDFCTVDEIMKVMKGNNQRVQKIIPLAVDLFYQKNYQFQAQNAQGFMTDRSSLSSEQEDVVQTLLS